MPRSLFRRQATSVRYIEKNHATPVSSRRRSSFLFRTLGLGERETDATLVVDGPDLSFASCCVQPFPRFPDKPWLP